MELPGAFSSTGSVAVTEAWWEEFGDSELNRVISGALSNNYTLRAVWDRLAQAEAVAARQGAALIPSVNAEASASRTRIDTDGADSAVYENEYGAGLVASYELDIWGRVRSARDAAALDVSATEGQVQAAAISLSAEIALTWFQLAEQLGQLDLLRSQIETSQRSLAVLNGRFRSGQSGAVDVLQQEQLVETRRGDLAVSEARVQVLKNRLAVLAGVVPGSPMPVPSALPQDLPVAPATGVPADTMQRRPDVARAYDLVQAADERVASAIADRLPRLSLSARVSSTAPEIDDVFSDWIASLAANLVGPVIDGGSRRAEVARAEAVRSEAINTYGQTILEAFAEVEDALTQEQRQRELIVSLDRQLELATQITKNLRDRYLSGSEDFLRILTAEISRQSLERNRLQAGQQLIEYRIGLYRALAGGLETARPEPANRLSKETTL
jgi:NodT family efflux transporter outer membrane factor (OMF) lipoprotein